MEETYPLGGVNPRCPGIKSVPSFCKSATCAVVSKKVRLTILTKTPEAISSGLWAPARSKPIGPVAENVGLPLVIEHGVSLACSSSSASDAALPGAEELEQAKET